MTDDGPPLAIALPTSSFLPDLGGAAVGLHNIAARLAERGHRPLVIAPYSLVKRLLEEGWRLPYQKTAFPPQAGWLMDRVPALALAMMDRYLGWLQRRHDFDFWHCTIGYPTGVWVVHFAERHRRRTAMSLPHLIRCTGGDIRQAPEIGHGMRRRPGVDRYVREWLPRAERLIATTETMADEYRALGVPEARIAQVPNGVDLARFAVDVDRAAVRRGLGLDPDAFLFLAVGRNHPKKNFEIILRAMAGSPAQSAQEASLIVAGDGAGRLQPLAAELRLETRVVLREKIDVGVEERRAAKLPPQALVELYRAADAFVFPSHIESFSIVLVEAMAAGLPVIADDTPGCRDVLRAGRDGILVRPGDVAALRTAMTDVMTNEELRRDLAARSLARAEDFSWDAIVDQYLALYREQVERAQNRFRERLVGAG